METVWFVLVGFMLAAYVVLDGFDLGVGALHLLLPCDEAERRTLLATIGPVWDGNEVWLIGAGAALFMAFPALYAAAFSGFFLPLMIVLWLLMGRGIAMEFRNHVHHPVWQPFWDTVFSVSSALLALCLGLALGNVVRGVPLDASGHFFVPLWTTFRLTPHAGFVDWYTLTAGLFALSALAGHGALWAAMKTTGELAERARRAARWAWGATVVLGIASTVATFSIQPLIPERLAAHPEGWVLPALAVAGLVLARWKSAGGADVAAFLGSCLFLVGLLGATAFALFPNVLPSNLDPARSLTVFDAASAAPGLRTALAWWVPGMLLVTGYFVFLYRSFAGRLETGQPAASRAAG
ncbi:MAG: cytochrome d ubiquinol oxidase subunit II [Acidobacteria bacterium]|nr:MAG: cytochrome d ubiquinol oxidase subunit II [Acidobacteriota bacterium]MCE7957202.1 cytochrome d ubiquinol oxidase subunit II [Acidobacteria bacterium ACB2]